MESSRLRDFALGFLFCAAIVFSYHCGRSDSDSVLGPRSAEASPFASNLQAVAAAGADGDIGMLVVDVNTGKIVASERVRESALATSNGRFAISRDQRYW